MASPLHITFEQWRALIAVVDHGGYARAAEALHKSQSSVTYAVQKLESVLGVKAFQIHGRKAVLTTTGQLLYRRAQGLVAEAGGIERAARRLSAGWEAEIRLAIEVIFPTWLLLQCLDRFAAESTHTRIELIESVLGGTGEALLQGQADLAIAPQIPPGFLGDPLMRVRIVAVAGPGHPLHKLARPLTEQDLQVHRQLVVRESGAVRATRVLGVEAAQRWTVSNMTTSIQAACMGYGFAWFPEEKIREQLVAGTLKPLPLREGGERFVELYLIFANRDYAGPGTVRLAEIIREAVARECPLRQAEDVAAESESAAVPARARRRGRSRTGRAASGRARAGGMRQT